MAVNVAEASAKPLVVAIAHICSAVELGSVLRTTEKIKG